MEPLRLQCTVEVGIVLMIEVDHGWGQLVDKSNKIC